jgi:hypothetical protein
MAVASVMYVSVFPIILRSTNAYATVYGLYFHQNTYIRREIRQNTYELRLKYFKMAKNVQDSEKIGGETPLYICRENRIR